MLGGKGAAFHIEKAIGWNNLIVWYASQNYNQTNSLAMHRNPNFYYEHLPNHSQQDRHKLSQTSKLLLSALVAFLWFAVTHGQPRKISSLDGLSHVQTTIEYIFQTTIAIEKKRFIKRIIEQSSGLWQYIPYANQPKWVDLQIMLTTRIGFDIRSSDINAGITPEGKLQIDFYEPGVLDKQWKTKIVEKSDYFFAKWDIQEFQEKSHRLLEDLASAESELLLERFKSDPKKMGELAHRLDQRLSMRQSAHYSPLMWIDRINRMVNAKVQQLSNSVVIWTPNSSPQILKPRGKQPSSIKHSQNRKTGAPTHSRTSASKFKQISYSEQQQKMRRQMKNQLNL